MTRTRTLHPTACANLVTGIMLKKDSAPLSSLAGNKLRNRSFIADTRSKIKKMFKDFFARVPDFQPFHPHAGPFHHNVRCGIPHQAENTRRLASCAHRSTIRRRRHDNQCHEVSRGCRACASNLLRPIANRALGFFRLDQTYQEAQSHCVISQ